MFQNFINFFLQFNTNYNNLKNFGNQQCCCQQISNSSVIFERFKCRCLCAVSHLQSFPNSFWFAKTCKNTVSSLFSQGSWERVCKFWWLIMDDRVRQMCKAQSSIGIKNDSRLKQCLSSTPWYWMMFFSSVTYVLYVWPWRLRSHIVTVIGPDLCFRVWVLVKVCRFTNYSLMWFAVVWSLWFGGQWLGAYKILQLSVWTWILALGAQARWLGGLQNCLE